MSEKIVPYLQNERFSRPKCQETEMGSECEGDVLYAWASQLQSVKGKLVNLLWSGGTDANCAE